MLRLNYSTVPKIAKTIPEMIDVLMKNDEKKLSFLLHILSINYQPF